MALVDGKNVVVLVNHESAWVPYACGRSCSFNPVTEFLETSVSGSGFWKTYLPTFNGATASIEGLINLEKINNLSIADLRAKQYAQERLLVRFEREDRDGNIYTDEFYCYISSSTDTGSFDNVATFSVDFLIDGEVTQVFTPSPILIAGQVIRYEYTATGGETYFEDADLIGVEILDVNRDGVGYSPIITTGTPIAKEAKYTGASGRITFPSPMEPGEEVFVIYQDITS